MTTQEMVKELIDKHGISKELLADKMKVSVPTITNWYNGPIKPIEIVNKVLEQILNGYRAAKERKENDV